LGGARMAALRGRGSWRGGVITGGEASTKRPLRVLIADDQQLVRAGLRMILEAQPDITVVAQATQGAEAVRLARRHRPDVVLMDILIPGMDGIEATRRIVGDSPAVADGAAPRVVILTTFDLDEYVYGALQVGACGFLLKDVSPERLVSAVRTVVAGDALLAPTITRRLVERYARTDPPPPTATQALTALTTREMEVFRLVARAMSNAEIAETLVVSEATVKTHVAGILAKLRLHNRAQAVVVAYESGLLLAGRAPVDSGADD
jgi:DNA-binding NarL/FixJ family response regulator